jgi:AcrR family transcriptional regulator
MSRESKPPIWARPEPRSRGLSRGQIVATALRIADEEGLAEVTIRRIARELRAGAMSLYHYFDSRDELLDLMGDTVAAEMLVAELPAQWRDALHAIAAHTRATFLKHPWMLSTLQDRPRVSPNLLRHIEQSAQTMAGVGVDPVLASNIVSAVDDYTIGFTLRELSGGERRQRSWDTPELRLLLESGEFPLVASFIAADSPMPAPDFELGLRWLLDGFQAQLA